MTFDNAVNHVLQQKKYDALMGRLFDWRGFFTRLIEKVMTWILDRLHVSASARPNFNTELITNIFIVLAVLLVAGLILAVFMTLKRRQRQELTMAEIFDELKNKNLTLDDLIRISREFGAKGSYREAVRYEYIAVLWLLNNRGVIVLDAAKTNGQLKREINRNMPRFFKPFGEAVELFNYVWFGHKNISADTFNAYIDNMDRFMRDINGLAQEVCDEK